MGIMWPARYTLPVKMGECSLYHEGRLAMVAMVIVVHLQAERMDMEAAAMVGKEAMAEAATAGVAEDRMALGLTEEDAEEVPHQAMEIGAEVSDHQEVVMTGLEVVVTEVVTAEGDHISCVDAAAKGSERVFVVLAKAFGRVTACLHVKERVGC